MGIESIVFTLLGISRHAGEIDEACRNGVINLLGKAKSGIKIVSGELNYQFYSKDGLLETLMQASERGVTIEIIAGPRPNEESLKRLSALRGYVNLYQLSQWPTFHFIMVDNEHVRLEMPHTPGQKEREEYILHNYKDAEVLEKKFDELKKQAKPLETA